MKNKVLKNGLVFTKGFCMQCVIRSLPGSNKRDCGDIVKELTGEDLDCISFSTHHYEDLSKNKTKELEKKRF